MRFKVLIFVCIISTSTLFSEIIVNYPNINGLGKETFSYAALELALKASGMDYKIILHEYKASDISVRQMLRQGKIDIADFGTSKQFEEEFLPIYIPIDYGVNGWRVFTIHKDNKKVFSKIKNINDLREFTAGQGSGWADNIILENAGLTVIQVPQMDQLFAMVEKKRFDYLPLGAHTSFWHLRNRINTHPNLVIDDNIVLIYPFARLFFLQKDNTRLHDIVKRGLEISLSNGSFLELFKSHKNTADLFTKANLKNRTQIRIENPLMSEEFKKIPEKYYFDLSFLE